MDYFESRKLKNVTIILHVFKPKKKYIRTETFLPALMFIDIQYLQYDGRIYRVLHNQWENFELENILIAKKYVNLNKSNEVFD